MRVFKDILIFILLIFSFSLSAQLSKIHYIPPLTATDQSSASIGDQYFYISTPSKNPVNYKILTGVGTTWSQGTVTNSSPVVISAISGTNYYQHLFIRENEYEQVIRRGFVVEADSEVYVSVRFNATLLANGVFYHGGAIVSKGESALGKRFMVGTLKSSSLGTSFTSFMATEDNTVVTVKLRNNVSTFRNQTGEFEIILNTGDSYLIANKDYRYGLNGTLIESNKPIVVNSGSGTGSNADSTEGQDYGMDQIVGADLIGSEYIFIKGDGESDWENAIIIANQNNTVVQVNDQEDFITLQEGDYAFISQYTSENNMYIKTKDPSHKLFAYQSIGKVYETNPASAAANQSMYFVPPLSCSTRGNVDNIAQD